MVGSCYIKKMSKLKGVFWILVLVAIGAVFVFSRQISDYFSPRIEKIETVALNAAVKEIKKQFSAPPPLRLPAQAGLPAENIGSATSSSTTAKTTAPKTAVSAPPLTILGTIQWTNTQRNNNDLPPLAHNTTLDEIAALRAKDMFAKQYFAHISPSGSGAETTANEIGYDYLALGENLALGNFKTDEDLVDAWMASPGHRANILNSHYIEIGVAVKKGIYSAEGGSASGGEGGSVWIAVQIFGKPASVCPKVDQSLKMQIETDETQLKDLQAALAAKKQEIENAQSRQEHNQKIEEYNTFVAQYNALLEQNKTLIANYNSQVSAYNQCIAQ